MKIANTEQLKAANNIQYSTLNRKMDKKRYKDLDPYGTHVCGFAFPHNDDHMRTHWLCKMTGLTAPLECWIDMPFAAYYNLTDAPTREKVAS